MEERAQARIDLGALRHNCANLRARLDRGVELCPVLKADGYGHGAVTCAGAALGAGADRIALATAFEASEIRRVFDRAELLVLGAMTPAESELAISIGAEVAVWDERFIEALSSRASAAGAEVGVHLKYDSGMGRLGCADPARVIAMARAVEAAPGLRLKAFWTHLATSDSDAAYMERQLGAFDELAARLRSEFGGLRLHAANSAAMIRDSRSHYDLVRPGVAVYGMDPFQSDPADHGLRPVLSLHSYVATVKRFEPGMSAGYGRTWRAERPTWVAAVPIGYGDGVRRALSNRGEALIAGRPYPIAGTISMDNLTIDLGPETGIRPGEEVTLLGRDGERAVTAERMAGWLETINYEITCGISPRVPRREGGESG